MIAKRFFYVSASLLMLAATYHLGAKSATAQGGANVSGMIFGPETVGQMVVMTPNGDCYVRGCYASASDARFADPNPIYIGNYWGGAIPATPTTWGKVKADYRR